MASGMDGLSEEQAAAVEALARRVAREEVASLSGLVMRRLQREAGALDAKAVASIFGEALSDFSGHTRGDEPGS